MKYQATNPEFSGPHPFQTQTWAKLVRRMFRRKEYLRWSDKYCHPLTVFGSDNLSRIQGPAIFVPNHQSHMDTPVIMSALPTEIQDNLF
ncbi:1-acyl-sn-glycerol-3-phosphate acyltransferase, partial [Pseudomonadales bacterium]|nr:1-acyl-sn-glycerol-3-phosphate acyltransferase [Pseudomonadales bacterium]